MTRQRMMGVLVGAAAIVLLVGSWLQDSDPRVRVSEGILVGDHVTNGITVFRGVPYAAPPVGELRWRPPVAPTPWEGERAATAFAPACPQDDGTAEYYRRAARRLGRDPVQVRGLGQTSEDCLYLNVWRPAAGAGHPLPIFVWVHGGAGTSGGTADPLFDGAALAGHGVVVVTVAYRIGALGFLAHPALSTDDPRGVSGNYALLDLIRALEWVRENGAAFGGDPARVTLAGQSAGATLAQLLLVSPAADGLFHRLVAHSGSALLRLRPLRAEAADTVNAAEARGQRFVGALGLGPGTDAAALRLLPVDSLLAAAHRAPADAPSMPVIDGLVLREPPAQSFQRGAYTPVPILTGFNDDEAALFMPPLSLEPEAYRAWVRQRLGPAADSILTTYPPGEDAESARRQRIRLLSDEGFAAPPLLLANWTGGRSPVYLYRFSWQPDDGAVGAFHSAEVPFLFGTHGMWWSDGPEVRALTNTMQAAWAQFAATGSPATEGLPDWTPASWGQPSVMVLNAQSGLYTLPRLPGLRRFADALAAVLAGAGGPR